MRHLLHTFLLKMPARHSVPVMWRHLCGFSSLVPVGCVRLPSCMDAPLSHLWAPIPPHSRLPSVRVALLTLHGLDPRYPSRLPPPNGFRGVFSPWGCCCTGCRTVSLLWTPPSRSYACLRVDPPEGWTVCGEAVESGHVTGNVSNKKSQKVFY